MTEKISQSESIRGEWLTGKQVCGSLNISDATLRRMLRDGVAPPHMVLKTGMRRYSRRHLTAWAESRMQPSGGCTS